MFSPTPTSHSFLLQKDPFLVLLKMLPTLETIRSRDNALPLISLHMERSHEVSQDCLGAVSGQAAGLLFPSDSLCLHFFPRSWGHSAKEKE